MADDGVKFLKKTMEFLDLNQQGVADILGLTQPTISAILDGRHSLTNQNAAALNRAVAAKVAYDMVTDHPNFESWRVRCKHTRQFLDAEGFIAHLPECPYCISQAFMSLRRD